MADQWVQPLRVTTPDGEVHLGALWPDGRVFVWPTDVAAAEAWTDQARFVEEMAERECVIVWAEGVHA